MQAEMNTRTSPGEIFVMKKANQWCTAAKKHPLPGMLFDEFWRESELAVLFSEHGLGKSVLATQIAESICCGTAIEGLKRTSRRQKVLYFDLDLTGHQFGMRYARETGEEEDESNAGVAGRYKFSDNLERLEIDPEQAWETLTPETFAAAIEPYVVKSKARVVIIDNITQLRRAAYGGRDEVLLMREMNRLKRKYGLSILVLATSTRRDTSQPLALSDLRASRILAEYADTAFAIGRSRADDSVMYIKHLRSKSGELLYDATNVALFKIGKLASIFLGAQFQGFGDEAELLREAGANAVDWIRNAVKKLRDQGFSYGEIAERLEISKTKAHRLRMQWQPRPERKAAPNPDHFPGVEEYNKAIGDPKFKPLYEPGHPESLTHAREYRRLTNARHEAQKEFKRTGRSLALAEALALVEEAEKKREAEQNREAEQERKAGPVFDDPPEPEPPDLPIPGVVRDVDKNGREIFVEKYDERHIPLVFYRYDSNHSLRRWEHDHYGNNCTGPVDTNLKRE